MSLAGFNQVIYEDNKTNKFEESLDAYQKHMAHKSLKSINIILFLNKVDILDDMLSNGITFIHPKYKDDGLDKRKIISFIINLYESKTVGFNQKNHKRMVFSHITMATNTENIKSVFKDLKNILVKQAMNDTGLI